MQMDRLLWIAAAALLPFAANAATKRVECKQTTDDGVEQMLFATLDDSSDKAEVEQFAMSAPCARNRTCGTKVYKKDVLPSMIRLTDLTSIGSLTYSTVIDIDRTTLSIVTRTKLRTELGASDTAAQGTCTVTVDAAKKLL